ncbi:DUF1097 domain-containing protein [Oharaeibacter diazotrophicus]|uniref:Uncharacterized protein DUF1097 n=1 Tax=Oharaeibacter diazotrophicus TaxID=1920512 RepID=A0A4R6R9Z1_9HYPH|nr:DUF1097 domain-containing protein [Oharaeibacter diazotrophicus]TDP82695.1 uncharacterized protein DUF1097 [Oharaeibacter diazotrophicus]BBE72543.1 hypothetical protein OHA_1_02139 [Pleomorphomonas sp. SM30]
MNLVTALAVVIGVLGAVATYLFLGPAGGLGLQIWAAFIAWAAFFHSGGGEAALKTNIPAHIWGSLCATVALILVTNVGIGELPVTAAVWVGVTVFVMIAGAHLPVFAQIPSAVYGYASTAGFALLANKLDALTSLAPGSSPFVTISLSMIIGSLFGYVSGKVAGALAK